MVKGHGAPFILFDYGKGGAVDSFLNLQRPAYRLGKGGFAGAQITVQPDHRSRNKEPGQLLGQPVGILFPL
ncbi:hypothetical protein D3C72_2411970 [compost metagenome]